MELVKAVTGRGLISPGSVAIVADKKRHSYDQLVLSARKISELLFNADLKIDNGKRGNKHIAGARVGIVAKPSAEFVAGVLGTWFSGGVAVPLALSYPEAELLHVMDDSDISMILTTEDHQELMKAVAAKTYAQLSLLPTVPNINTESTEVYHATNGGLDDNILHEINGDDAALIIYTSGTTGKPKGVVHTHKGILAQVLTLHTHKGILAQVQMLTEAWGYTSIVLYIIRLGLPDKDYGEAVTAVVIPNSEIKKKRAGEMKPAITLEELSTWAKQKLAPYKIPTRLLVWDSMPRNAMGKVNKKELKKKLADQV